jgi:hypothetical protein
MSSTRDIQISTDVFSAIWAARKPGENNEDAILRRLLAVSIEAGSTIKSTAPRPVLSYSRDDDLGEAATKLLILPIAPKQVDIEKPSGQTGGITSPQRRWEKIADTLADPFRLVY